MLEVFVGTGVLSDIVQRRGFWITERVDILSNPERNMSNSSFVDNLIPRMRELNYIHLAIECVSGPMMFHSRFGNVDNS